MFISGSGIVSFEFRTDEDFKIDTKLALDWFEVADSNYFATDWGSNSDVYQGTITTYGTETYINNIITQINNNRISGFRNIYMTGFADDEHFLGEDIDYTTISGAVMGMQPREAISWKVHKLEIKFRAHAPSFSSVAQFDWNTPGCVQFDHRSDRDLDINKYDSYDSRLYIYDHEADSGTCDIKISISNSQLASLRQFHRVNRGNVFTLPLGSLGLSYPFGPRSSSGPHNVKLLSLKEETRISPVRQIVRLTFSEQIS